MLLDYKDIQNVQRAINKKKSTWESDDAKGLKLWVEANGGQVLLYQEQNEIAGTPFLFVFALEWQMEKMATLGHGNAVAMDATFGVNEYEYSLYTMLCFDEFQNGIPACWALMETHKEVNLVKVLTSIKSAMQRTQEYDLALQTAWTPSCFIVDCVADEQNALNHVWPGIPIALCIWHVRRAWTKNVLKKVRDPIARASMNRELGDIMVRNRYIKDIIWRAIIKARSIPDSYVSYDHEAKIALVRSQSKREDWHAVEGYDGHNCICTCGSSVQGNTCKHQIKLLRMGGMKETKILQVYGTQYGSMLGMLKLIDELFSLDALEESMRLGPTQLIHSSANPDPFRPIPGADKSLKRKESFVDKFMRRGRGRPTAKKKCKEVGVVKAPEREVNATPFVRIVIEKQSDQAKLDAEALKCIDLNVEPDWHFTLAMGKAKKVTKKVTNEGRKATKSNAPGCGKEDVAPIGIIDLNAKAVIGFEEVQRLPTAPQKHRAKPTVEGEAPAKPKLKPRSRKIKVPPVIAANSVILDTVFLGGTKTIVEGAPSKPKRKPRLRKSKAPLAIAANHDEECVPNVPDS
ncbi:unnamed protein product [Calypogeia fissa]